MGEWILETSSTNNFPGGTVIKKSTCQWRRCKRCRFEPLVGKIPCSTKWQPAPIFLPGESHGQRSLVGYSPWDLRGVRHDWVHLQRDTCTAALNTTKSKANTQKKKKKKQSYNTLFCSFCLYGHIACRISVSLLLLLPLSHLSHVQLCATP